MSSHERTVAYFSMEIALQADMPTYGGGLGILAGDTLRSAADLQVPLVAVTLLHRKGYFRQRIDAQGNQFEEEVSWPVEDFLVESPERATLVLEGRTVTLRAWRYDVKGVSGGVVPVYFLDANLLENSEFDRTFTDNLYGGDRRYRLCQEAILGIGGVRMLRALGYQSIERFHMNEGHSSLLTLELLQESLQNTGESTTLHAIEAVREKCIFTTHTPVPAGHDQFPTDLVNQVLGSHPVLGRPNVRESLLWGEVLNMTYLGLNLSGYINGVAKKHREISQQMFPGYTIDAITNGVHAASWTSGPFQALYDKYIPGWRGDSFSLRYALSIPQQELWNTHLEAKRQLLQQVRERTGVLMDENVLTLGFARRVTGYKRAGLIFHDIDRLKAISSSVGKFQIVFAGKAHPQDQSGKETIRQIYQTRESLRKEVPVVYLEDYDMNLGRLITSGVDVWLNVPQPPLEASGTSGMKAALNGVPSLSILDGWWIEGCIEGITGWSVGKKPSERHEGDDSSEDATSLYGKLEYAVVPLFYERREDYIEMMGHAIALNGSFFNTQRMIQQYVLKAYFS